MPGGNAGRLNSPSMLVVVSRCILVAGFVNVTVAPAITAPDGSLTVPVIWPVGACAHKAERQEKNSKVRTSMVHPLCPSTISQNKGGRLIFGLTQIFSPILELGEMMQEHQIHLPHRTVPLLGHQ